MTANESKARSEQYLRYQDIKEGRRRRLESERIAKLPSSASLERASAELADGALRDQYDRDRSDFVARHVATLELAAGYVGYSTAAVKSVSGSIPA